MKTRLGPADLLGVFLLAAVLALGAARLFGDSDPAMHVATGRFIVENGQIPRTDPFSATFTGRPWFAHEWLAGILWYGTHRVAGWQGLLALSAVLIAGAQVVLLRGMISRGNDSFPAFAAVALAAGAASIHWLARPHLWTILFVAVFATLLEDVASGRTPVRRLAVLPPVLALWANLHGGFLAGLVVLGAYVAGSALANRRLFRPLALTAAASAAATLLNPYGASLHAHLLDYFAAPREGLSRNAEFAPANLADRAGIGTVVLLLVAFGILAAHLRASAGRRDASIHPPSAGAAIALAATGAMALASVRHVALAAVFAALVAADGAAALGWMRSNAKRAGSGGTLFGAACVAVAALALAGRPADAGYDPRHFPVEVVRRLRSSGEAPAGPVFAPDLWGGYLVLEWPAARVFVDGRSDMYGDEFLVGYARAYEALPGWRTILSDAGVRLAILPRAAPLALVLASDPGWEVVDTDVAATVFRRRA